MHIEPTREAMIEFGIGYAKKLGERYVRRYGTSAGDAEDLAQEMMLALLHRLPAYDPDKSAPEDFVTYTLTMAMYDVRRTQLRQRRDPRRVTVGGTPDRTGSVRAFDYLASTAAEERFQTSPRTAYERVDVRLDLAEVLATLPPTLREVAGLLLLHPISAIPAMYGLSKQGFYKTKIYPLRFALIVAGVNSAGHR